MNLPNINIEKILEQFSNRQKFFVWITIVGAIVFLGFIYFITPIAKSYFESDNHNCSECRDSLNNCNREYAELSDLVRGYLAAEERERLVELQMETEPEIQTLDAIENDIRKDSIKDMMRKMTITNWVEEQGK